MRPKTVHLAFPIAMVLALAACSGGHPPNTEVEISPFTKVLDAPARAALHEISPGGTLRFLHGTAVLAGLAPGDILVSEPTAVAPYGLLRRVTSVRTDGDALVVETEAARLQDAIRRGSLEFEQVLTEADLLSVVPAGAGPQAFSCSSGSQGGVSLRCSFDDIVLFDSDGDSATTGDQLRADGSTSLTTTLYVNLGLDYSFPFDVSIGATVRFGVQESFGLRISGQAAANPSGEIELYTANYRPIVRFIGPVPIVFRPRTRFLLGLNGQVTASLDFSASEQLSALAGFQFDLGGYRNLSDFQTSFSATSGTFTGSSDVTAYGSVRPELLLYDDLVGRIYAAVEPYLEFDGRIPRRPTWRLYGGLRARVGVTSFLDDYEATLFDEKSLIAQAANAAPSVRITNPTADQDLPLGLRNFFTASASDPEDGGACCTLAWTSNVDGPLGTGVDLPYTFTSPGPRTITVTARDSDGASASASVDVTVVNSPPQVTITQPAPGAQGYRDQPLVLRGTAYDTNEPGLTLPCSSFAWQSSNPADRFSSVTGCSVQVILTSNGQRTITLTGTDPQGASASASVTVTAVDPPPDLPPVVQLSSSVQGGVIIDPNTVMNLSGSATDPEGQGPLAYRWQLEYGANVVLISTAQSLTWKLTDTLDPAPSGDYPITIRLRVTDPQGNTGEDAITYRVIYVL